MKLSVVMPFYNAADTLGIQLEALANQHWPEPWEVIVVDNRSTDGSRQIAEQYKERLPNLRIVDASARQGSPFARNVGVQVATGEAIAFCDADDEVAPGWVAAMGEALSWHDFVACSIDIEKLNSWVVAGRAHPQRDGLPKFSYPPYLLYAGAGTLGIKRSLYIMAGGFDESLLCLYETDFCFKLQLAGVPLHFVPDAVIHVRLRHTLRGAYNQARVWAVYRVQVCKKYQGATQAESLLSWKRYVRDWQYLLWRLPFIRQKQDCLQFMRTLGSQVGLLQGSLKYRTRRRWGDVSL